MLVLDNSLVESIDEERVLNALGYHADAVIPARILSLVNDFAENSPDFVDLSYSYVIRDIHSVEGEHVTIDDEVTFSSDIIARLLEHCQKVAVFVLTIGDHMEQVIDGLAEDGNILKASVLDAIASNTTEKVAELVQEMISEEVRSQGLCTGRRFSPGYCDWDVNQQEMVFRAMNGSTAGIRLTGDYLMIPRKSISGIIGIGMPNNDIENYNPCKTCQKRDCLVRRV